MVVVTKNASDRLRGFLASVMLEIDAGVYVTNNESPTVRDKIWAVINEWTSTDGSAVLVYRNAALPGKLSVLEIGHQAVTLTMVDGLLVSHRK